MPQATVFKSTGVCTDTSLPILYRDPAASAGSLYLYDALDLYSWPSQGAAAAGNTLVDLLDISNASFVTAPTGWSNGFIFDGADNDRIVLPTSSKIAAGAVGFGQTFWIKFATIAVGVKGILDLSDGTASTTQYGIYRDGTNLVVRVDANGFAPHTISSNVVYQIGITSELSASTYTHKLWINGQQVKTFTTSSPFVVPAATAAIIGNMGSVSVNGDDFTFYRCHADNLSTRTAAQFIAADYAAGAGRFS